MNGYKTYLLSALAIIIAVLEFIGWDVVPNIDQTTALNAVWAAVAAITLRHGSKTDAGGGAR